MRPLTLALILAACALALCGPDRAPGSWGGGCAPAVAGPGLLFAQPFMPPAAAPQYEWRPLDDDECVLYRGGAQIGNYRYADGLFFRHLASGGFESEASEPPIAPPDDAAAGKRCKCSKGCKCGKKCNCGGGKKCNPDCKCVKVIGNGAGCPCTGEPECNCPLDCKCGPTCTKNYGVARGEISQQERCTINGREVTKDELNDALMEPAGGPDDKHGIPDDAAKNSLTVMGGTAEQRAKIHADMQSPAFKTWFDAQLYQEYDADSPMLKCGFKVAADHPTIYFQAPDGKVLARIDPYEGPLSIEKVRKADPNYNPNKDPPNKPKPQPGPSPMPDDGDGFPLFGVVLGAIAGLGCFGVFGVGAVVLIVIVVLRAVRKK